MVLPQHCFLRQSSSFCILVDLCLGFGLINERRSDEYVAHYDVFGMLVLNLAVICWMLMQPGRPLP